MFPILSNELGYCVTSDEISHAASLVTVVGVGSVFGASFGLCLLCLDREGIVYFFWWYVFCGGLESDMFSCVLWCCSAIYVVSRSFIVYFKLKDSWAIRCII